MGVPLSARGARALGFRSAQTVDPHLADDTTCPYHAFIGAPAGKVSLSGRSPYPSVLLTIGIYLHRASRQNPAVRNEQLGSGQFTDHLQKCEG